MMTRRILLLLVLALMLAGCARVSSEPGPTPAPADSLAGTVTGQVRLPALLPAPLPKQLLLFVENADTGAAVVVPYSPGRKTYSTVLPAGNYLIYAWSPDYSSRGFFAGCVGQAACDQQAPQIVRVGAGETVAGVDVTTWQPAGSPPLVLIGRVLDGTGANPTPDTAVVIMDRRVVAVMPRAQLPDMPQARVIDLPGTTILPGFFNAHVHNAYEDDNLRAWAQAGVTTVRDLGAPYAEDHWYYQERDYLNQDAETARVIAAGPLVTVPGGYPMAGNRVPSLTIQGPEDARAKIADLIARGADLIKIVVESDAGPTLSQGEIAAIVETAHEHGVPVTAHVTRLADLRPVVAAGVDDVAHMAVDPVPNELIRQMVQRQIAWVPTLEALDGRGKANLRRYLAAGGQVALGSDAGYLAGLEIGMPMQEIELMRQAGMSSLQIILAATRNAAQVCRVGQLLGTLEPGKLADLLVVRGDPLEDLAALTDVALVVHDGVVIRQEGQSAP